MVEVGAGAVGEVGAAHLVVRLAGRAGEERLDADRHQPALDPARDVVHDVLRPRVHRRSSLSCSGSSGSSGLGSITTILPASRGRPCGSAPGPRISLGAPPLTRGLQPAERLERGRAAGAVGGSPRLRWKSRSAVLGRRAEVAVDAAHLEAHVEQPLLQREHVVAGHHVAGAVVEHPVAERPARLVQPAVGGAADHAVDGQAALLLEVAHRQLDALVVRRAGHRVDPRAGRSARGAP